MTVVDELWTIRSEILEASKGADAFIDEQSILSEVLPSMLDAKLVDSEDFNESYFVWEIDDLKLNGYAINETQERLQLFVVDESFTSEALAEEEILVSEREHYDRQFKRATRFVRAAYDASLSAKVQDSDPTKVLAAKLSSPDGVKQFDVVEVFLVTLSATVSKKGRELQLRDIHFDKEKLIVTQRVGGTSTKKELLLLRRVIDLNFLHSVQVSKGNREPLIIDFERDFGTKIEVIQAAGEANFASFLGVLRGDVLANMYRLYSGRLLEKNVRSFLQFRGANRGMRDTIREEPEKFIAYNNGLTITAIAARVTTQKRKIYIEALTDFQIVNGGQTTASIYFSGKDGLDISSIQVVVKINVVNSEDEADLEELITSISRYSNTQSKVSNVDLRSRSPQLRQLKTLSESIVTPTGKRWFFERAKGEFHTSLRSAGGQKNSQKNKYPPARRFSKEQLAKYYTAWGETPHLVKKGGEKVFRHFIEVMTQDDESAPVVIDRAFYEDTVAKIILFRELEQIYGQGRGAVGQIRSAVVPYAISCLYAISDGAGEGRKFALERIWKHEGLDNDLREYLRTLLVLCNELIKKYAKSDDIGEYAKNPELWKAIRRSDELGRFLRASNTVSILQKYVRRA